jgi:heme-degrading monooxygenase HmoA
MSMSPRVVTVFRNRLRPDNAESYAVEAARMTELAAGMPGFVDSKTFSSPDGERVTIVTFADRASHDAWRDHPEHRLAQQNGIDRYYAEYSIQVGDVTYEHIFHRASDGRTGQS